MTDYELMEAKYNEMRVQLDNAIFERNQLEVKYEDLKSEKIALEMHHQYLMGQNEGYRVCLEVMREKRNDR